ncbi:DUF6653 family protein [Halomarina pelagica]|uniref:DUF6653 family protein n=1 Tax=Halomarina pelagica TaxID=2961599 RepID=UPI0020C341FE|nr:DUF6653 family protein [Halomarina sp. BND7]
MEREAERSTRGRLEDAFWERHSNPKSGWSRTLLGPLLVVALYRRDRRLFALVVLATVLNPIAFGRPDPDADGWMTRAVRAERWWLDEGNGAFGLGWPNVLNALNVPLFGYALYAAYARKPIRAAVGIALSTGLKLGWVASVVRRYDRSTRE